MFMINRKLEKELDKLSVTLMRAKIESLYGDKEKITQLNEQLEKKCSELELENKQLKLELSNLKSFFELPKPSSLVEHFMTMKYEQRCENLEAKLKELSDNYEKLSIHPAFTIQK